MRKHYVASLPIVGAEASTTCSLGPGLGAAIFSPFFFRYERALRGVPNARRTHNSFCIIRLFSLSRIARAKRGAESALESFEELQVRYSHSSSESCRIWILRLISKSQRSCFDGKVSSDFWSELGKSFVFKFKCLLFFLAFFLLRALLHVLYYPTHVCLPLAHLLSHLAHFPPLPPFSLFATMVCVPLC